MSTKEIGGEEIKQEKASFTGGVRAFSIEGHLHRERERCFGMTPEERMWRRQWLKDQLLSPNEPVKLPNYDKLRYNPLRRFYRWPLDRVQEIMEPITGPSFATSFRLAFGKLVLAALVVYGYAYQIKYNRQDWTSKKGFRVTVSDPKVVPGDPGFPRKAHRKVGADYYDNDLGFKNSPI